MISVLLPVRDPDLRHLSTAIDSVLRSSVDDLELLVVEDMRTAGVLAVLENCHDARIRHVIDGIGNGLGAALNAGIAAARSGLIARMDADDVCEPERFAKQIAMFSADPNLTVAGSQLTIIDGAGEVIGLRTYPTTHDEIAETLTRYNCLAHSSVMFRKDAVERIGGYATRALAEDYDLWCRLLLSGARLANHSEALVRYRFHAGALKHRTVRPALRATIALKKRYFSGRLGWRARTRLVAEQALILLPPRVVIRLFALTAYQRP